jgi:prevent-host-death family protein
MVWSFFMNLTSVKPISYVKAHAAEILDDISTSGNSMGITQHGEVKAVLIGLEEYKRTQETMAFLKLVALGDEDIRNGRTKPVEAVAAAIRTKIAAHSKLKAKL